MTLCMMILSLELLSNVHAFFAIHSIQIKIFSCLRGFLYYSRLRYTPLHYGTELVREKQSLQRITHMLIKFCRRKAGRN